MVERFIGWHTIYGVDGEHVPPYMTRIWIGRLRLHIFYRGDNDPDPHDHPWPFWTFPLTSYVEEVYNPFDPLDAVRWIYRVRAFRLHRRPATYCHRVIGRYGGPMWPAQKWPRKFSDIRLPATKPGKIITIVWRGRGARAWGFLRLRDRCWIPWRRYVYEGGKHAPCEPVDNGIPRPTLPQG